MLQEKKCGEKTELTDEEKAYLEKELNGQYTVQEQIGRTGARTAAYYLTDKAGNKFVLKIAAQPNGTFWSSQQTKGENAKTDITDGYYGRVFIPRPIVKTNNYIVEPYAGVELCEDVYDALPEAEKNKIAYDIAEFLNFMHQKYAQQQIASIDIFKDSPCMPLTSIESFFLEAQTPAERKKWAQAIHAFKTRDTSDEITTRIHGDIRGSNILYNPQTKKVAIIDFETTRDDNIYRDFVPFASFRASYDMLFRIIDHYNQMPKKAPIYINPEKVMLMHQISYFHELARCGICRNFSPDYQQKSLSKQTAALYAAFCTRTKE